jgi:hypothetical protein
MLLISVALFFIPLLLLGVLAFRRFPNKWHWAGSLLAFAMTLGFLWLVSRWDLVSMYYRMLLPIMLLLAAFLGFRRIRAPARPWHMAAHIATIVINAALIIIMGGASWKALEGYPEPEGSINLVSPLRDAKYVVLHGGASPLINGHFWVKSQKYALDILGQDSLGRSARVFASRQELDSYAIFSQPLYSPCNGTVKIAVDRFDDQAPPKTDRDNLAGNHVLIECEGVEVVLAHMKKDSVSVRPGDSVTTRNVLGLVGNTGNTSEPHLHMHVETLGNPSRILDGRGVPFTLDGDFLVRGNRL